MARFQLSELGVLLGRRSGEGRRREGGRKKGSDRRGRGGFARDSSTLTLRDGRIRALGRHRAPKSSEEKGRGGSF